MQIYVPRRRKLIILAASAMVLVGGSFASSLANNFISSSHEIHYSSSTPSIVNKNNPNDLTYVSPVVNSDFKPQENNQPKVDLVKPKEETPKEVIKQETPKVQTKIKEPVVITKIETPVQRPSTPRRSLSLSPRKPAEVSPPNTQTRSPVIVQNSSPVPTTRQNPVPGVSQSRIQYALERYRKALANEIKTIEFRVSNLQAEVNEIERSYKEDFDKDHIRGKIPKTEAGRDLWKEAYQRRIDLPRYNLNREKNYLEYLKNLPEKTSLTLEELKSLRQGLVPSLDTIHAWEYEDESKNPTLNRLKRHNASRTFNTPSWYSLSPWNISNGEFPGWSKSDVSSQFSSEISSFTNSIKVYEYKPNSENEDKNRQPLKLIQLDANDNNAFEKFQEIMAKISQKDSKVQAIRIKNIGEANSLQNASSILEAIPSQINTVSVFLNNVNATKSLRGLESKKLKELSIYTEINSVSDEWSINPNGLKNVDFISFDYNNQATFDQSQGKIGGSIVFSGLRWEKGDTVDKINEGLSIVFDSKINQRVFQGNFGGKGGWPTTLDFSETDVNTFKGIKFAEFDKTFNEKVKNWEDDPHAEENYPGFRKLKFTRFIIKGSNSNGANSLNFKFSDLDGAQFTERFSESVPGSSPRVDVKIDGRQINSYPVYISGSPTGDSVEQLRKFISVANGSGNNISQIFVESEEARSKIGSTIGTAQVLVGRQSSSSSSGLI
ncbi:putative immunoglobulin-blocking virulence protein [Mesomycoplasma ovipneumoniae]|uniref:putative immunoglobulin-blocking virulence protein n=1 Tax=Mesomycoplasma ovipneumoniae TaxID=29562 RepID=UPI0029643AF9|nr:putative immunoglobulin-blocking virulence protein [Mesomycoplasma ovipneumoniae]MDW2861154.1 putative immunoglobulin-blocking virulence protein [Mesomycoplasma ovipneumoniae]